MLANAMEFVEMIGRHTHTHIHTHTFGTRNRHGMRQTHNIHMPHLPLTNTAQSCCDLGHHTPGYIARLPLSDR